jgi:hypothetical protein
LKGVFLLAKNNAKLKEIKRYCAAVLGEKERHKDTMVDNDNFCRWLEGRESIAKHIIDIINSGDTLKA